MVEVLRGETHKSSMYTDLQNKIDNYLISGTTESFKEIVAFVYKSAKDSLEYYTHMLETLKNRMDNGYSTNEDLVISSLDILQFYANKMS